MCKLLFYSVIKVLACSVSLPSRWGLTFLLCLVVAIPTTVINFVPDDYPLNITISHLYEPREGTTHGLDIQNLLLLLLATFVQVQCTSMHLPHSHVPNQLSIIRYILAGWAQA